MTYTLQDVANYFKNNPTLDADFDLEHGRLVVKSDMQDLHIMIMESNVVPYGLCLDFYTDVTEIIDVDLINHGRYANQPDKIMYHDDQLREDICFHRFFCNNFGIPDDMFEALCLHPFHSWLITTCVKSDFDLGHVIFYLFRLINRLKTNLENVNWE